ncbi:MAG: C10 family peptidase [Prevotella sp.]|nr:C10 family peptidase [Prevotella sp.]
MKHLSTLLLPFLMAFATTSIVWANPIDEATARQNARQFISQGTMRRAKGNMPFHTAFTINRSVKGALNRPMVYAFNIGDDGGFIIASGDDAAEPILGYGEGRLDIDDLPCNMLAFLEGYADEIAWAQEHGLGKPASKAQRAMAKTDIANMVTCKWAQEAPYYNNCPKYNSKRCLTGCVATAMAQVMYYWGKTGRNGETFRHGCTALDAYTTESHSISLAALDSIAAFDWDNLINSYSGSPSTAQKNAVAQLMRYCGQSVEMDYDPSGSGAMTSIIPEVLVGNFGYDKSAHYIERSHKTYAEWEDIIYAELAEGRPVIIDGTNSKGTSGHAFICTGYQASTNKFYINWGWAGKSNAYYALTSLIDTEYKGNYTYRSAAVIGIQPPTDEPVIHDYDMPEIEYLYLHSSRTLDRTARASDSETFVEMESIVFGSEDDAAWDYGIGVINAEGQVVEVKDQREDVELYANFINYKFHLGGELPYGTYKLTPVCRRHGEEEWRPMYNSNSFFVKAEVEETKITLTPSVDIRVTKVASSGSKKPYTNKVTIANDGCLETFGLFHFKANTTDIPFEARINPGASSTITLPYTAKKVSSMTQALTINDFGFTRFYTNVAEANYGEVDHEIYLDNYVDESNNLYGDTVKVRLHLINKANKTYNQTVKAIINESYGSEVASQSKQVQIPSHGAETLEFDFTGLNDGTRYAVTLQFKHLDHWGEEMLTEEDLYIGNSSYVTLVKGIVVVTPDGQECQKDNRITSLTPPSDALYVDARYSNKHAQLRAGGNANTIYLLPEGATIPDALQGCNVVVGDHASKVALEHGHGFCSPIDFTADEISYTRTFDTGHNNKTNEGWSTISLPFAVESDNVSIDGESTTWFQTDDDHGRKFWLHDFASEEDQVVTFGYTSQMEAYKPYLIAVPDDTWGTAYDLRNKAITFTGYNALVRGGEQKAVTDNGGKYDFIGRPSGATRSYIYDLNEAGNTFAFVNTGVEIEPFTAYFVGYYDNGDAINFRFNEGLATPRPPIAHLIGDANGDGEVTVADVTVTVDYILGREVEEFFFENADAFEDGVINVTDVTAIVSIILGQ